MRLLILGGTVFLGRHLSALALDGGHRLTLFNRGRHNPDLFPHAQSLRGDRDDDLRALAQGEWDAVIDTSGYVPRIVRKSARMLSERAGLYVFISSISVYAGAGAFRADEDAPLAAPCASTSEEVDARTYGPFKAQCEAVVTRETNGRCLIIRPGLIVGPHDPSDRFTYWPRRLSGGGEILAPGSPERQVQFIDVRDLSAWILRMIAQKRTGVFNATGPARPLTMKRLLQQSAEICDSLGKLVWVPDEFLQAERVEPYTQMPLWMPGVDDAVDCGRAIKAGLAFRPLRATIWDTFAWDLSRPPGTALRAGLPLDREIAILRAWNERKTADA